MRRGEDEIGERRKRTKVREREREHTRCAREIKKRKQKKD